MKTSVKIAILTAAGALFVLGIIALQQQRQWLVTSVIVAMCVLAAFVTLYRIRKKK